MAEGIRLIRGAAMGIVVLLAASAAMLVMQYAGHTTQPTETAQGESAEIYNAWSAARGARLLALPLDVEGKDIPKDPLLVLELGENGYRVRKLIDGGFMTSWSPQGELLAFDRWLDREVSPGIYGSDVGIYSPETGSLISFPHDGYVDTEPVWRQDGSKIAFERTEYGNPAKGQYSKSRLMIVPVSGGAFRESEAASYPAARTYIGSLQWRPGSDEIAYVGVGRSHFEDEKIVQLNDIYLLDTGTGKARKLTDSGDIEQYSVGWSPDGNHLAFATGIKHLRSLEIMDASTGKRRVVLESSGLVTRFQNIASIRWSPDGKRIVFDASRRDPGVESNIGIVEYPAMKLRWLTRDYRSKSPRWSGDGRILFIRNGTEIWQMMPDGTGLKKLYSLSEWKH